MTWQQKIDDALTLRRSADALRRRYAVTQGAGRWLLAEGRQYLNFSSNDYLGLSHHPQIVCAWQQGAERFGVGSGVQAMLAAIPSHIRRWKTNWRNGWVIHEHCCSFPVSPPTRR